MKLKTFKKKAPTNRHVKNHQKNLSSILANAFRLLKSGNQVVQTCKYPLAIANMDGKMRSSQKSVFRDVLVSHPSLCEMF